MIKQCPASGRLIFFETKKYDGRFNNGNFLIKNKQNDGDFVLPYATIIPNLGVDMNDDAIDERIRQEELFADFLKKMQRYNE